jgi:hypothetical protein
LREAIEVKPQGAEKLALILSDASAELARMDRYERRALWRRKFAIREFDAVLRQQRGRSRAKCSG